MIDLTKPPTPDEIWDLRTAMIDAAIAKLGTTKDTCPVGANGIYPWCNECWKIHMDLFTDPFCVDHG